ncbi:methionine-synthesizing methyltetrahydropteroyltriglutamate--homocysteine [Salix suchowensis]|nr:methionine-synthesizing methyltetrahydropteroyltriglutamate--homocysteine [Salix suchowensis]
MVSSSVLGFPRIGGNREIKKAVEAYWGGKISAEDLTKAAFDVRKTSWSTVKAKGVDFVPSGEFSLYDHVLDHSAAFNVIPSRYTGHNLSPLDVYFAMGRGRQADGVDVPASEMKKWYVDHVRLKLPLCCPRILGCTDFKLLFNKALEEYKEAKEAGPSKSAKPGFEPISLLPKLLPAAGVEWVQIDEPILAYATAYAELAPVAPKILLATYFGRLDSNLSFVSKLPVAGLHIDLDRAPGQLDDVIAALKPTNVVLSLGLVSGRNIWKTDFEAAIKLARKAIDALGQDRVIVATSSSLLHTPVTLESEKKLTAEQKDWFSFALEKAAEVATIAAVLSGSQDASVKAALEANKVSIAKRRAFEQNSDDSVRKRVAAITPNMFERASPFAVRQAVQAKHLNLPKFPTTTIGSFPVSRIFIFEEGITQDEYDEFIKKEIETVVRFQEKVGLDLLVHGEPERNDMVQYFGEQLNGFVFTQNAWVQSYGSRFIRPTPIIVSDVSRSSPMTVRWSSYAQSLTKRPMKGMLTGPVTILNWSFPRADVSLVDLEKAGISAIQVDEPAIREGVSVLTHSHFCYSDFDDIFPSIQRLDADVISIEASKSDMKLLTTFKQYGYSNQIGPGQEIKDRVADMLSILPDSLLFINPDCGLKTRGWKETEGQHHTAFDSVLYTNFRFSRTHQRRRGCSLGPSNLRLNVNASSPRFNSASHTMQVAEGFLRRSNCSRS